ncbi:MAG TPA: hypothetical protein VIJ29_02605 [Candidatus Paceibacterota bacterium]
MNDRKDLLFSPYLHVCTSCFQHAWIFLPVVGGDTRVTREFASREIGRKIVDLLSAGRYINSAQAKALNKSLDDSLLPPTNTSGESLLDMQGLFIPEREARYLRADSDWPPMLTGRIQ